MTTSGQSARWRFLACGGLFVFIYAAFGVHSPFLPPLLHERGAEASWIGVLLAAGTAVKLIAAPLAGGVADHFRAAPFTLTIVTIGSALASLLYVDDTTVVPLFFIVIVHALFTGPMAPLSDAVGLAVADKSARAYGWLRGAGSAAFIVGIYLSGRLVQHYGIESAFISNAALLVVAAAFAALLHGRLGAPANLTPVRSEISFSALLAVRPFRLAIIISGLILGSHALHDGFTMIRWREAGMTADVAGTLWALAVGAEVVVFFLLGGPILAKVGPRGACLVSCGAAVVRWIVMAITASPLLMAFVQPLHGLTFALLHLACMQVIAGNVPRRWFGTAQGLYATLGAGVSSVLFTLVSGALYGQFGASAFWAMAMLSACAAPLILRLPGRTG